MNEYIITMENLLHVKKENNKKEPTKAEKTEFMEAWMAFASEDGYSEKAEQFLYEGFRFCGAEPFYQFLKQSSNQEETIKQLFIGKLYGKDSNVTFRIVAHLLALMMNDNSSVDLIEPIIKQFPAACLNKEGKRLGTATKTTEKFFLNVLSPTAVLHPLKQMKLNPCVINSFLSMLVSLINELKKMDSIKEPAQSNILRVENWAKDYFGKSIEKENACSDSVDEVANGNSGFNFNTSFKKEHEIDTTSLSLVLDQAKTLADQLQKENDIQKKRIMELEIKNQDNSLKLAEIVKELENERKTVAELRRQKYELEDQSREQQKEIDDKGRMLHEKDAEITERIKMSEVLSRDRARQANESLQRIASKIRVEYRDFKDAIDAPMTVDLGENLRLQLLSVFKILEKSGMKIG